jgi:hypothetical protein
MLSLPSSSLQDCGGMIFDEHNVPQAFVPAQIEDILYPNFRRFSSQPAHPMRWGRRNEGLTMTLRVGGAPDAELPLTEREFCKLQALHLPDLERGTGVGWTYS